MRKRPRRPSSLPTTRSRRRPPRAQRSRAPGRSDRSVRDARRSGERSERARRSNRTIRRALLVVLLLVARCRLTWSIGIALARPTGEPDVDEARGMGPRSRRQRHREPRRELVVHEPSSADRGPSEGRPASDRASHASSVACGRPVARRFRPRCCRPTSCRSRAVAAAERRGVGADRQDRQRQGRRLRDVPASRPDPHERGRRRGVDGRGPAARRALQRDRAPRRRAVDAPGADRAERLRGARRRIQLGLQARLVPRRLLHRREDGPTARRRSRLARDLHRRVDDRRGLGP